ncbi:MAG: deaminase, partial [Actinobacteria bacterium]|nr:deaminase [Actinomycetota bacterium]
AVLVGAGTVRRDDPRLSIRLDDAEEHRPVAVLSRSLELSPDARLFARNDPASVLVFTGPDGSEASARAIEG